MNDTEFALSQLGLLPIAPDAPCGVSARYEPEYERLMAEIGKLESLAREPIDWEQVVTLGVSILREKSKDLLVASYLTRGLFERQGYVGLEIALTIYRDLLGEHWDRLFPEASRVRARIQALDWVVERVGRVISRREPSASEHEAVTHCLELGEQLGRLLEEKLGEQSPKLTALLKPLGEFRARVAQQERKQEQPLEQPQEPKQEAKQEPKQEAKQETKPVASQASSSGVPPAAPLELTTDNNVQRALRSCQESIRNVAAFLRNKNLADPLPYRILRVGTWLMIEQLPPSKDYVTQLPRVSSDLVGRYEHALRMADYKVLIPEVEENFFQARYWLDAHRFTATALEALGLPFEEARRSVVAELAHFVQRFPGVIELKFSDGTPFADDQTRLWIEAEVLTKYREKPEGRVASPEVAPAEEPPWMQVGEEAKILALKGKFVEGVALLQEGQKSTASERERFLWRLERAKFCFETGYLDLAIPQLEFLDEQVECFSLEEWEPALSLEVAQILLLCYYRLMEKTKRSDAKLVERTERLYARLCRLDLLAALATDKNKQ